MSEPREPIRIDPGELPPESGPVALGAEVEPGRDALAILALVLGILSIAFGGVAIGPVAMLCGVVAAMRARGVATRSRYLAASGILCGLVGTILWTAIVWHWVSSGREASSAVPLGMTPISAGTLDRKAIDNAAPAVRGAVLSSVSVVLERKLRGRWQAYSSGSGTVVAIHDERYYILTCRHVVDDGTSDPDVRVRIQWIGGDLLEARRDWISVAPFDLAVVSSRIEPGASQPQIARIGSVTPLGVGDPVFAVGDPLNFRLSYVSGVLSAIRVLTENGASMRVLQTQVPLNPGNSGGGLFNAAGELIAVNSWRLKDNATEGIGFAIALENLPSALADAPSHVVLALGGGGRADATSSPGPSDR